MKKRCLVIADGFYEWRTEGKRKFPMYIRLKSGEPFGFAGLYNVWTSPDGKQTCTCTIITTEANEAVKPIHERMPVILPKDKEDFWINPAFEDKDRYCSLISQKTTNDLLGVDNRIDGHGQSSLFASDKRDCFCFP